MAKADAEDEKPTTAKAKVEEPTWPKSEHISHAWAMYGQPKWLVEHMLKSMPDNVSLSQRTVSGMIANFQKHKVKGV